MSSVIDWENYISKFIMENDENQPPKPPQGSGAEKLTGVGTLLKESHRDNIDLLSNVLIKSSSSRGSVSYPEEENGPQRVLDEQEWKDPTASSRCEENEVQVVGVVQTVLVESPPYQIEELPKPDTLSATRLESPHNLSGEKHDSHSICSTDYTPSDSSFDTAREDFQHSLPDLLLIAEGVPAERSDTDYESATDFDETSLGFGFSASSPRHKIPSSFILSNIQTVVPNKAREPLQREQTPIVLSDIDCSVEWNDNNNVIPCLNEGDSLVPFDRESTPKPNDALGSSTHFLPIEDDDISDVISPASTRFESENPPFLELSQSNQSCEGNVVECINNNLRTSFDLISCSNKIVLSEPPSRSSTDLPVLNEHSLIFPPVFEKNTLNSDAGSDISVETVVDGVPSKEGRVDGLDNIVSAPVIGCQKAESEETITGVIEEGDLNLKPDTVDGLQPLETNLVSSADTIGVGDTQTLEVDSVPFERSENKEIGSVDIQLESGQVDVSELVTTAVEVPSEENKELKLDTEFKLILVEGSKPEVEPELVSAEVTEEPKQEVETEQISLEDSKPEVETELVSAEVTEEPQQEVEAEQISVEDSKPEVETESVPLKVTEELKQVVKTEQIPVEDSKTKVEQLSAEVTEESTDVETVLVPIEDFKTEVEQISAEVSEDLKKVETELVLVEDSKTAVEQLSAEVTEESKEVKTVVVPVKDTIVLKEKPETLILPTEKQELESQHINVKLETELVSSIHIENKEDIKTEEVKTKLELKDEVKTSKFGTSENNEEVERLDTKFGTVFWQSNFKNCQIENNKLTVPQDTEPQTQEETQELDLDERLKLEAAIVAEEVINSSLREDFEDEETTVKEAISDSKIMRDMKMADSENNETHHDETVVEDGGKMDENVNPFQSKSKVGSSPPIRRNSGKLKNGEVTTPTKINITARESPLKKSPSAPKPSSGSRSMPIASPKRKGSETTPTHTDVSPVAKDQVDSQGGDVDIDGFRKPFAKQTPPTRSSSSKISQNETEAGDAGIMMRSVEDNISSEAGPDVAEFSDAEFRSAAEVFKDPAAFEFLQLAGSKHLSESALARMSLYVKFDPLLKAISPVAKRTLSKTSTSDQSQISTASDGSEDLLMLGTPTGKEMSERETNGTPVNKNSCVEGRLLDLSPSPLKRQLKETEGYSPGGNRVYSEEEFIQALRMQELLFQEQLLKKDKELDEKEKAFEQEMVENANRLTSVQKNCEEMRKTVLEYEKTISQLIDDREREKLVTEDTISMLKKERDQALEDLQGVEKAFGDLHRRFEKSKAAVEGFKKNEEVLTNYVKEGQVALKKQEQKYELLKRHAEETLTCANQEIDALRRSSEVEIAALRAQLKKAEMKVDSLEKSLQQMNKENSELTNICDELIAKVGQSNA